jgi:hypothetical protein
MIRAAAVAFVFVVSTSAGAEVATKSSGPGNHEPEVSRIVVAQMQYCSCARTQSGHSGRSGNVHHYTQRIFYGVSYTGASHTAINTGEWQCQAPYSTMCADVGINCTKDSASEWKPCTTSVDDTPIVLD